MNRGFTARARTTRVTASVSDRARGRAGSVVSSTTRSALPPSAATAAAKPPTKATSADPSRMSRPGSSPACSSSSAAATRSANAPPGRPPLALGPAEGERPRLEIGPPELRPLVPVPARQPLLRPRRHRSPAPSRRSAPAAAPPPRSGFSAAVSSRAATAATAASISAICVANMSRNSPEIRQVTSTRGRPNTAGGSTSTPVTRAVASSHTGRQPISASPCAISSPPVRRLALPQRSITSARGQSPCSCANRRSASSAAALPERVGRRRRQRPRIGGVEVAPGRQHVGPPARRRPRRPRRHVPPVERREQRRPLRRRAGQPRARLARRRPPEDVQPVLDREVLEVAEPGVDPHQRRLRIVARPDARPRRPARSPAPSPRSAAPAARAAAGRAPRPGHTRPPAAPAPAAPSLRPAPTSGGVRCPSVTAAIRRFACAASPGLRDDERIDDRQRPGDHLGKARARQRHRLPRQPLQRPVRPHMHQRMALRAPRAARARTPPAHAAAAAPDRGSRPAGPRSAPGPAPAPRSRCRTAPPGSGTAPSGASASGPPQAAAHRRHRARRRESAPVRRQRRAVVGERQRRRARSRSPAAASAPAPSPAPPPTA